MTDVSFNGLLIVAVIAVVAPILVATVRWLKVPAVVVEIVAGIVVGPSVLGWVRIDPPIQILALVGLAFLLFLAGLEIDLRALDARVLRLAGGGFVATLVLGLLAGLAFHAVDWVRSPAFLAVALSATSLGLVVPVLKDAGQAGSRLGQLTIAGATVADFGGVILLSLFFSESEGSTSSRLITLGAFVVVVGAAAVSLARAGRSLRLDRLLTRLQDTTAEIRVRIAVALLIGFVALAARVGLETILGAFLAGAVLGFVDRDTMSHPHFRAKLDAVGYGFLIPVFFVSSGVRFDLDALTASPSAFARIPLFLLALLVVRGVPAGLYASTIGWRGAVVAGLLQATSLPFIVTATTIGVSIGAIAPVNAAALVAAGLLSVVLFPLLALGLAPGWGGVRVRPDQRSSGTSGGWRALIDARTPVGAATPTTSTGSQPPMTDAEPVLVTERRGNVSLLRLNRPEARNALSPELMSELGLGLEAAEQDPEIGAVVVIGTGDRAFCAGMDLRAFAEGTASTPEQQHGQSVFFRFTQGDIAVPIIGAANATAVAGGFEVLLGCDLVVASSEAKFGVPEVKRGLFAAGGGVYLSTRIPLAIALELTLTGDTIDAERAAALGLVNRVVPPDQVLDAALALAGTISKNGPLALQATKQMVRAASTDMAKAQELYAEWQPRVFQSEDAKEGATAFIERRDPVWKGR